MFVANKNKIFYLSQKNNFIIISFGQKQLHG